MTGTAAVSDNRPERFRAGLKQIMSMMIYGMVLFFMTSQVFATGLRDSVIDPRYHTFDEIVTLYCQLISLYEDEFTVSDSYGQHADLEYALVYPK